MLEWLIFLLIALAIAGVAAAFVTIFILRNKDKKLETGPQGTQGKNGVQGGQGFQGIAGTGGDSTVVPITIAQAATAAAVSFPASGVVFPNGPAFTVNYTVLAQRVNATTVRRSLILRSSDLVVTPVTNGQPAADLIYSFIVPVAVIPGTAHLSGETTFVGTAGEPGNVSHAGFHMGMLAPSFSTSFGSTITTIHYAAIATNIPNNEQVNCTWQIEFEYDSPQ